MNEPLETKAWMRILTKSPGRSEMMPPGLAPRWRIFLAFDYGTVNCR